MTTYNGAERGTSARSASPSLPEPLDRNEELRAAAERLLAGMDQELGAEARGNVEAGPVPNLDHILYGHEGAPDHVHQDVEVEAEAAPQYTIQCVSANVQKSHENTTQLLEKYRDADIICVQEIFWGKIKMVVSSKNKKGDVYEQTCAHRNFACYGASKDSRVATYVNRKWRGASPHVITGNVSHDDTLLVSINTPDGPFMVLNVYNDSNEHAAVSHLLNVSAHLPHISMMCGDFNLRHASWDKCTREHNMNPPHAQKSGELMDLAAELQLLLVNSEA